MIPRGSSAAFTARIAATPAAPNSSSRNPIFPIPIPCSPVQVPSIAMARRTMRSLIASASASSASESGSIMNTAWKLPSPTWPTIPHGMVARPMSSLVSAMHSASLETGTQTSPVRPWHPGRSARIAGYASWRAFHRRARSSCRRAYAKAVPPRPRPISSTSAPWARTSSSVPWNSKKTVGVSP